MKRSVMGFPSNEGFCDRGPPQMRRSVIGVPSNEVFCNRGTVALFVLRGQASQPRN